MYSFILKFQNKDSKLLYLANLVLILYLLYLRVIMVMPMMKLNLMICNIVIRGWN